MLLLKSYITMAPEIVRKKTHSLFVQPNNETIKIEGKMSYHDSLRGWAKIIFKKDLLELCKDLQDRQSEFGYELEYPVSEEAKKKFIEHLMKEPESWPFFLRIKKIQVEKTNLPAIKNKQ
jgi:hypothetical protein